ncbi:CoA transferase [Brucella abortus]|uniref:CoA transferase n=1 Tax=Brucella abortus TaxID=235 RepID=UPI0002ECCB8B|nr:CoA transferase [Brucella abortus]
MIHRDEIIGILAAHFLTGTADEWIGRIHPRGVPVGAINDIARTLDEPQVKARNMLVQIPHPLNKDFVTVGSPHQAFGNAGGIQACRPHAG